MFGRLTGSQLDLYIRKISRRSLLSKGIQAGIGTKVDYLQLPPVATDQYNKFITTFQFQSPTPDVVQIDVTWPAQFALPGWLAPLDQYITPDYLNQFWPSARSIAEINGKIYGIQRFMDIGMLYYRTDLVQKYGGKVPQTRDEMQAMAEEIVAEESKHGVIYGYLELIPKPLGGERCEKSLSEYPSPVVK